MTDLGKKTLCLNVDNPSMSAVGNNADMDGLFILQYCTCGNSCQFSIGSCCIMNSFTIILAISAESSGAVELDADSISPKHSLTKAWYSNLSGNTEKVQYEKHAAADFAFNPILPPSMDVE